MKLNQATAAALLSATLAASPAYSSHEELASEPNLLSLRILQGTSTSSKCTVDTAMLKLDFDFASGIKSAKDACADAKTTNGDKVTINYGVCDPEFTNSVTETCNAVNGTVVSGISGRKFHCTNGTQSLTLVIKEMPECIAPSCNVTNWETTDNGQLYDLLVKEAENVLAMKGMECSSVGKATRVLALAVTSAAAALLLF